MGKAKDLHIETMNLASEWTSLVGSILNQPHVGQAFQQRPDESPSDEEEWKAYQFAPDFVFTPAGMTEITAIEIKMIRWRNNWLGRVSDAVSFMEQVIAHNSLHRGVIIFTVPIAPVLLIELNAAAGDRIRIWDLDKLRELASTNELSDALEGLAAETMIDGPTAEPQTIPSDEKPGRRIADKLRATPAGTDGWPAFEAGCHEAIQFLFGKELHNLVTQQRTDDGLNRLDLIGRIRPGWESFWGMIATDFATRYVVFDAKNYAEPVGQAPIYTTAKYLMRRGLRAFAIIIAREGASPQAFQVAAGDLRETGKFILIISMADLCLMLDDADRGDPPENRLFDRLDEVLMTIGR
ncbi:hypothetical protein KNJ79_18400 [Sphingopyxis indica]|uniref:hypothetical protein n=1 Tax=Sphingopyxis indica TaxID=436663 RepID=UPI00293902FC|nr:hypothetical protein [Sphingopyxis indica]WOF43078.1 hypothetical protein KNJ79_18400 [Sphingopyxis indica]